MNADSLCFHHIRIISNLSTDRLERAIKTYDSWHIWYISPNAPRIRSLFEKHGRIGQAFNLFRSVWRSMMIYDGREKELNMYKEGVKKALEKAAQDYIDLIDEKYGDSPWKDESLSYNILKNNYLKNSYLTKKKF